MAHKGLPTTDWLSYDFCQPVTVSAHMSDMILYTHSETAKAT